MKYVAVAVLACSALVMSCGEKFDQMKKGIDQAKQVTENVQKAADQQNDAQKVYAERKAKGDTVAKPYKELQTMLPTSIAGFKAQGEPSGAQQTMGAYSYSNAAQTWVSESNPAVTLTVTVNDWGGGEGAFGMASAAFAFVMEMDDAQKHVEKIKFDDASTSGFLTYTKQSHDVEAIAGTQYRYILNVKINGASDDQSAAAMSTIKDMVKNFVGK